MSLYGLVRKLERAFLGKKVYGVRDYQRSSLIHVERTTWTYRGKCGRCGKNLIGRNVMFDDVFKCPGCGIVGIYKPDDEKRACFHWEDGVEEPRWSG